MRKKKNKKYKVNFDMVWSKDVLVSAASKTEAKKKAFDLFLKRAKKADFKVTATLADEFSL